MSAIESLDLENYAELLVWALRANRKQKIRNGDCVVIRFDHPGLRLVEALYSRLMDEHLNPVALINPTSLMEGEMHINSSFGQLSFLQPGLAELYESCAGVINVLAPASLTHLAGVDPRTLADRRRAQRPLGSILERRRRGGSLGWTTCLWPTEVLAQAAGMTFTEYEEQLLRACWLNMPDPVAEWRRMQREMGEITAWLDGLGMRSLHVESDNVDLTVVVGDNRRFLGMTGTNIPSCEVYVAPDCRKVSGMYYSDQPSVHQGRVVIGAHIEFVDGVAVRVSADEGTSYLQQQLFMDSGARRVGEFSMTDKRFSRVDRFMAHTLLDENHGGEFGNCHIALGASVLSSFTGPPEILSPELMDQFGFNGSGLHWDLVNTRPKRVTAVLPGGEKKLVYENGSFMM